MKRVCPETQNCNHTDCNHHGPHSFFVGCESDLPCKNGIKGIECIPIGVKVYPFLQNGVYRQVKV